MTNSIILNPTQQLYKQQLHTKLGQTTDFDVFIKLIGDELTNYGICDWAYTQLDLPDRQTVLENLGTLDQNYIAEYVDESFYECDMLLRHVKLSDHPCFQSDIEKSIKNLPFEIEGKMRYEQLLEKNKNFGFHDVCSIPVASSFDGSRFLLTLTTRKINPISFKNNVIKEIKNLKTFASAINDIGVRNYSQYFISPLKKFKALESSQPLKLLKIMVENDLSIKDSAQKMGITETTARKHLSSIRKSLNTKTNHAACSLAVKYGIIK